MKKSTFVIFVFFLFFIPMPVKADEPDDKLDMEKYNLLMSYASFGKTWENIICNDIDNLDYGIKELLKFMTIWNLNSNGNLSEKKRSQYITFLFDQNMQDTISSLEYLKTSLLNDKYFLLHNTPFCIRLNELDKLTTKMYEGDKILDKIPNEDYLFMSYASFISTWKFAIFDNFDESSKSKFLELSSRYFKTNYRDAHKIYIDILMNDSGGVKKFLHLNVTSFDFDFQKYMTATPLYKRWVELDKQTYEFFSNWVEE